MTEFNTHFKKSVINVFEKFLKVKTKEIEVSNCQKKALLDISIYLPFYGKVVGALLLSMSKITFLRIVSAYRNQGVVIIDKEASSVMVEAVKLILENFMKDNQELIDFYTPPAIMYGKNHEIFFSNVSKSDKFSLSTSFGDIFARMIISK